MRREAHRQIDALLLERFLSQPAHVAVLQPGPQLAAHVVPRDRDRIGRAFHGSAGLTDENRAREVAVVGPAGTDAIDHQRHAIAERGVDHLRRRAIDDHEEAGVSALCGFGEKTRAQLPRGPRFARRVGSHQRRFDVLPRCQPHKLQLGRRLGEANAPQRVRSGHDACRNGLRSQHGLDRRIVYAQRRLLQFQLAQSVPERSRSRRVVAVRASDGLAPAALARRDERFVHDAEEGRRHGWWIFRVRRCARRRIGLGVGEDDAVRESRLVRVRVVVQERVRHQGNGSSGIATEDREHRVRVTHPIELRPVVRDVKHVRGMRDDQRIHAFPLHEEARTIRIHQRRFPEEPEIRRGDRGRAAG